ncbi:unnamed protein product [Meloidogyne enterolobii]|uniref:Uncharacterized protein n=1 Tax=Meloidogyne enterolobii TaxID=390850 RepID=A0ACB0ZK12_MELEN
MSENLQGVDDDLVSTLCSCSTFNFEDSLNRIKLLEVEKDKTNLAFQLILAKLDLQIKDLAEDRDGQIKTLTERNAAYSDAKYEAEKKVEKDKTNLAFQLILAKLDLVGVN